MKAWIKNPWGAIPTWPAAGGGGGGQGAAAGGGGGGKRTARRRRGAQLNKSRYKSAPYICLEMIRHK
jgi:hypothetical protein